MSDITNEMADVVTALMASLLPEFKPSSRSHSWSFVRGSGEITVHIVRPHNSKLAVLGAPEWDTLNRFAPDASVMERFATLMATLRERWLAACWQQTLCQVSITVRTHERQADIDVRQARREAERVAAQNAKIVQSADGRKLLAELFVVTGVERAGAKVSPKTGKVTMSTDELRSIVEAVKAKRS